MSSAWIIETVFKSCFCKERVEKKDWEEWHRTYLDFSFVWDNLFISSGDGIWNRVILGPKSSHTYGQAPTPNPNWWWNVYKFIKLLISEFHVLIFVQLVTDLVKYLRLAVGKCVSNKILNKLYCQFNFVMKMATTNGQNI